MCPFTRELIIYWILHEIWEREKWNQKHGEISRKCIHITYYRCIFILYPGMNEWMGVKKRNEGKILWFQSMLILCIYIQKLCISSSCFFWCTKTNVEMAQTVKLSLKLKIYALPRRCDSFGENRIPNTKTKFETLPFPPLSFPFFVFVSVSVSLAHIHWQNIVLYFDYGTCTFQISSLEILLIHFLLTATVDLHTSDVHVSLSRKRRKKKVHPFSPMHNIWSCKVPIYFFLVLFGSPYFVPCAGSRSFWFAIGG